MEDRALARFFCFWADVVVRSASGGVCSLPRAGVALMRRRGSVERAVGVGWGLGGVALRGVPLRDECQPSGGPRLALPGTGSRHPGRDDGVGCAGTAGQALPERRCHLVIPAGCRNPGPRRATSMLAPRSAWWDRNRVPICGLPSLALGPGIRAGTTWWWVSGRRLDCVIPAEPAPDLFRGCRRPGPRRATLVLAPGCE